MIVDICYHAIFSGINMIGNCAGKNLSPSLISYGRAANLLTKSKHLFKNIKVTNSVYGKIFAHNINIITGLTQNIKTVEIKRIQRIKMAKARLYNAKNVSVSVAADESYLRYFR